MNSVRDEFRSFLVRLGKNELRPEDWKTYAVAHFADEEIETLRRRLVKESLAFPDWQVGWIPRAFQAIACDLAETIRDDSNDTCYYRPQWSGVTGEGTILISVSIYGENACGGNFHSSAYREATPDDDDYPFWSWVLSDPELRRKTIDNDRLEDLRQQFQSKAKAQSNSVEERSKIV